MVRVASLILCLLITYCYSWGFESEYLNTREDPYEITFVPFPTIVKKLGYPVEVHKIVCDDGYILTFFRIQAKGQKEFKKGLPVVYLQHGVIDSSDTWVVNNEANALGLRLANEGYDVWCGNSRGNKYSLEHIHMKASEKNFWQFSWQNMSIYDLPAAFEHIYQKTEQPIDYIGHSQGTTIMLAALSEENPTILKYLNRFIALAPITWVQNISSGPIHLAARTNLISIVGALGMYNFMPANFFEGEMAHYVCKLAPSGCGNFLGYFFGFNAEHDNYKMYGEFLRHVPSGTSLMGLMHWRQLVLSGRFCRFDYGKAENLKRYGQTTPTDYDLSKITQKIHLFLGSDDSIGDLPDQAKLLKHLKGTTIKSKVYGADHMTWMWAKDIDFYYSDLLKALQARE